MIKKLFGKNTTSKGDVLMALAAVVLATWKAIDTYKDYQSDQEAKELEA